LPFAFGHLVVASAWLVRLVCKDRIYILSGPVVHSGTQLCA
jgi:hypothetical protein